MDLPILEAEPTWNVDNPIYSNEGEPASTQADDGMYHKLETPYSSAAENDEIYSKLINHKGATTSTTTDSDTGSYSKLFALNRAGAVTKSSEGNITIGKYSCKIMRLVCILLIIMIVIITIAALSASLALAFYKISELNSEVASLEASLEALLVEVIDETSTAENIDISQISLVNTRQFLFDLGNSTSRALSSFGQVFNPAPSCAAVLALVPSSLSGYYWIRSSNGSAVCVYCDMTRSCGGVTGGWMRVAELDMTNSSSQCPSELRQRDDSNIRTCGIASRLAFCSPVTLPTGGILYSQVCGRILAYQYGTTDAFGGSWIRPNQDINTPYVDGASLTHGNPRQHIWTFAAALHKVGNDHPDSNCPCTNITETNKATPPPAFVNNDYFCDTGSQNNARLRFYGEDPLWDGAGCGPDSTCCSFNNPPWFYKQLPAPTTDDIEMRVCRDDSRIDEDIAIEAFNIYVQ